MISRDSSPEPRGFCPLPWIHLSANTDTSMRVCCNTDHGGHVRNELGDVVYLDQIESLSQAMNQNTHKDLRSAMLRGERPDFCKRCYVEEDGGGFSIRQIYNRHYKGLYEKVARTTALNGEISPEVSYIDFSLSNNCNLQCRMCGPSASFPLKKEFDELALQYSPRPTERARAGWNFESGLNRIVKEAAPGLREMLTTGGEPFLSPQHLQILDAIIRHGRSRDVVLRYHSNLTVLPEKLTDLWSHFKAIEIHVSLEGVAEMNEYVRYPGKWSKILSHLDRLVELRRHIPIYCEIHTCLQAISWLRTHELLEWTFEYSKRCDGLFPRIPFPIWVDQPYPMTLLSLPPSLRALGSERILRVLDRYNAEFRNGPNPNFEVPAEASFRGAIERLRMAPYEPRDFQAFMERTQKVDRYRGHDLSTHVPEFKSHSLGEMLNF